MLVRSFLVRGNNLAQLDPLGMLDADLTPETPAELTIEHYGWKDSDLDHEVFLGSGIMPRFKTDGREKMTIREIIKQLERIYCEVAHKSCRTWH